MRNCIALVICALLGLSHLWMESAFAQCLTYQTFNPGIELHGTASFADSLYGMIGASQGRVYRTTNGGITWTESVVQDTPTAQIYSVAVIDSITAYAVCAPNGSNTDEGAIYFTSNGGMTWVLQQIAGSRLFKVSFADRTHGLVSGCRSLYITSDGGDTWTYTYYGMGGSCFMTGISIDAMHIVLASSSQKVVRSRDGGVSWQEFDYPGNNYCEGLSFTDSLNGIAVDPYDILKTTNGGQSWSSKVFDWNLRARCVDFSDRDHAVVGGDSVLLRTSDGGATWSRIRMPGFAFQGVTYLRSGKIMLTGSYNGAFVVAKISSSDCPVTATAVAPQNGAINVPLNPSYLFPRSTTLFWSYSQPVVAIGSRVQVSTDSTFTSRIVLDTTVAATDLFGGSYSMVGLAPRTKYFWRAAPRYFDGTAGTWSSTWNFRTACGFISGVMFNDLNRNGVRDGDELVLGNWIVNITGEVTTQIKTDDQGAFTIAGIDSGTYHFVSSDAECWLPSSADTASYSVHVALNDSLTGYRFGWYYLTTISPPNKYPCFPLFGSGIWERHVPLQWKNPLALAPTHAHLQLSSDSAFSSCMIIDSMVFIDSSPSTSFNVGPLLRRTTYYWRLSWRLSNGDTTGWGSWRFTTSGNSLSGRLFNDKNENGRRDSGETGFTFHQLLLSSLLSSGTVSCPFYTDSSGAYFVDGIDSGWYSIMDPIEQYWFHTVPSTDFYELRVGVNDSVTGLDFGRSTIFTFNRISGRVFDDRNENGNWDSTSDRPLSRWRVHLDGPLPDDVWTDSSGNYVFPSVIAGVNSFWLTPVEGWEYIAPVNPNSYTVYPGGYGQWFNGFDFALRRPPRARIKLILTVQDTKNGSPFSSETVTFGIRPGASAGIWGVDPAATNIDFSEGEFEIPPPTAGMFDVRFEAPNSSLAPRYGEGCWTDVREFRSSSQSDTFKVSFQPNRLYGGDYPMRLSWTSGAIAAAFDGVANMILDPSSEVIDMKSTNSITITDPRITVVRIVTSRPTIEDRYHRRWHLMSLDRSVSDDRLSVVFPTLQSRSRAYWYNPSTAGYQVADTLSPTRGYWLKYAPLLDTMNSAMGGSLLLADTIGLDTGWNMIGSLSVPITTDAVSTDPPNILASPFYGYLVRGGYRTTDTLVPGSGYWIKAYTNGRLILSSLTSSQHRRISSLKYDPADLPPPPPAEVAEPELPIVQTMTRPTEYRLDQNYPNPFNPMTVIRYRLPVMSVVTIKVYNLLGREVATLVGSERKEAGEHTVRWNAGSNPSGVYFYKLIAGSFVETKKLLLLR